MKIINCEQGSQEWHLSRLGIPTASNFDEIIDLKGNKTTRRDKYLYKLAGERITGKPEETYQNGAMIRGQMLEEEARQLFEIITGKKVKQVGFCVTEGKFIYGSSPDGIIEEDKEGLEIKCPLISTHVSYLLKGKLPSDYFQQVQGNLLVTGLKEWNFLSYYPSMKPLLIKVKPDEEYQKILKKELELFCAELCEIVEKIR